MTGPVSGSSKRRLELRRLIAQLDEDYDSVAIPAWQVRGGPVHVHRRLGSQFFAKLFILINVVMWTTGAVLIFVGEKASDLGIAMVVGATFSFATFLTEVWTQTVDREEEVEMGQVREQLHELRERRKILVDELLALDT